MFLFPLSFTNSFHNVFLLGRFIYVPHKAISEGKGNWCLLIANYEWSHLTLTYAWEVGSPTLQMKKLRLRKFTWLTSDSETKARWGFPDFEWLWPTDGRGGGHCSPGEKYKKLHLLIDFKSIWDSGKFGWASSLECLQEAELWLRQGCVCSPAGAHSQAPDSSSCPSHS